MKIFAAIIAALISFAAAQPIAYLNADVYTVDTERPRAEAFLVEDGAFTRVGSRAEVLAGLDEVETVDLAGATVLPGLIDAHGHLINLGRLKAGTIDLAGAKNYDEVIELVKARAAEVEDGIWILGRGWDNESWPDKALPDHTALSEAVPNHPVWLERVDGHASLANAFAMTVADVDPDAESPRGGEIIRRDDGSMTGVFIDNAEELVAKVIPDSAKGDALRLLYEAQKACLRVGLTGVHDMGVRPDVAQLLVSLQGGGLLKLRVTIAINARDAIPYMFRNPVYRGERVSIAAVKLYIDGAMGSRGAWLLEPYADRPTDDEGEPYAGLAVTAPGLIETTAKYALARGFQIYTHAIGDRANREVLDAYERAAETVGKPLAEARFRVEHAQLLHPDDIARFARLGVIASMQPTHCSSDKRWVEDRVGPERALGAYAWASLLRSGATIAAGSDFPVESENPFLGFYAAITRQNTEGEPLGGWYPDQRMTRTEALRAMTLDAAYSSFDEGRVGSIEPGKRADFIVIDRDVMTVEPRDIPGTRVLRTVIDGETVYKPES